MPSLNRPDGTTINYEVRGERPSVLALAPGIVNSEIAAWDGDAVLDGIAGAHGGVVMDQRYAGASTGPNYPFAYSEMSKDQLAVADATGMERFVVVGRGIGANYALRLACQAPERVAGAVLIQPLGRPPGAAASAWYGLFAETWRLARAEGLASVVATAKLEPRFDREPGGGPYAARLAADDHFVEETLRKGRERYMVRVVRFRDAMFPADRRFFSVGDDETAGCAVPALVVAGDSPLAPRAIAEELARSIPGATLAAGTASEIQQFVDTRMARA
jgi:pimeloyl-ACP methyl ester carboxylesterase